jgi:hypothetical protein
MITFKPTANAEQCRILAERLGYRLEARIINGKFKVVIIR